MKTCTGIRMELIIKLDCGCTLQQTTTYECTKNEDVADTVEKSAAVLRYWAKDRSAQHVCALVSEQNPNGLPPKEKKEVVS
jgi:hypothetical protein